MSFLVINVKFIFSFFFSVCFFFMFIFYFLILDEDLVFLFSFFMFMLFAFIFLRGFLVKFIFLRIKYLYLLFFYLIVLNLYLLRNCVGFLFFVKRVDFYDFVYFVLHLNDCLFFFQKIYDFYFLNIFINIKSLCFVPSCFAFMVVYEICWLDLYFGYKLLETYLI